MLSWSPSVKKAKASLDSGLLLAFDLTQRTDSHLMSMIRYAINHIVKFTIKCCSHVRYVSKTMVVVRLSDIHA
ncbi:BnaCnng50980D [Brassica napus]|uniref:BnaCnng50980D protein n=2 Tax=Brassica TaxID=3705 RepID=A0A078JKZ2_BRANA|nr:BnaCnng50980D [Brassica napus]